MTNYSKHTSSDLRHTFLSATGDVVHDIAELVNDGDSFLFAGEGLNHQLFVREANNLRCVNKHAQEDRPVFRKLDVIDNPASGSVTIDVAGTLTAGNQYKLLISDTTEGFPDAYQELIFVDPLAESLKGLSLSQAFVKVWNEYKDKGHVGDRFIVEATADTKIKVTALNHKSTADINVVVSHKEGDLYVPVSITRASLLSPVIAETDITLDQALELYYEGINFDSGYDDHGWLRERYEDIGSGGAKPQVGDTLYISEIITAEHVNNIPNNSFEEITKRLVVLARTDGTKLMMDIYFTEL